MLVGAALWLTAPETADPTVEAESGDPEQGRVFYLAGGCLGCHKPAADAEGSDPGLPSGGHPLPSPVGTFHAPNITPHEDSGIGAWSFSDFVTAMREGTSPGGNHYFPAFPYASYRTMSEQDLAHLYAYLMTLEPVDAPSRGHDIVASGLLRPFLGIWKAMALGERGFTPDTSRSESWN
ncbi:MAG: cytochrome c, partial [Gammaproteobacteria bacterium]|nr:cytochrome c [Gammaproteobacteria bacterium]